MKRLKILQDMNLGVIWIILTEDALPVNPLSSFQVIADFEMREAWMVRLSGFLNPCVEVFKMEGEEDV